MYQNFAGEFCTDVICVLIFGDIWNGVKIEGLYLNTATQTESVILRIMVRN